MTKSSNKSQSKKKVVRSKQSKSVSGGTLHPYTATIIDPWRIRGVRIPDQNTYPSAVLSYTFKQDIQPVQSSSDPTSSAFAYAWRLKPYQSIVYSRTGTSTYSGTTLQMGAVPINDTNLALIGLTLCDRFRVVSASIAVYSNAPALSNRGKFYVGWTSPDSANYLGIHPSQAVDFNDLMNSPFVKICPVAKGDVCSVNYRPQTETSFEYKPWGIQYNPGTSELPNGSLWCAGQGIDYGSVVSVSITMNLEYIPLQGTVNFIPVEPSYYDIRAIEQAANINWGLAAFHREDESVFSPSAASSYSAPDLSSAWRMLGGGISEMGYHLLSRVKYLSSKAVDYGIMAGTGAMLRRLNQVDPLHRGGQASIGY